MLEPLSVGSEFHWFQIPSSQRPKNMNRKKIHGSGTAGLCDLTPAEKKGVMPAMKKRHKASTFQILLKYS